MTIHKTMNFVRPSGAIHSRQGLSMSIRASVSDFDVEVEGGQGERLSGFEGDF